MQVGLIGAGNMARGLARGWGRPILATDPLPGRAQALVDELGGEALAGNVAVAQAADLVVLCHKPAQLAAVAAPVGGDPQAGAPVPRGAALGAPEGGPPHPPGPPLPPS